MDIYLKEWRKHAGLSQLKVERRMGLHSKGAQVSRIENGKRDYDGKYLRAFAVVVGCPHVWMLFFPPDRVPGFVDRS